MTAPIPPWTTAPAAPSPTARRARGVPLWLLFFGTALALVLLMQWFVVARVVPQVEAAARTAIDESLQAGREVWQRRAGERAREQEARVALIAKDQGFLGLLNPEQAPPGGVFGDEWRPTLAAAMESFGGRAGYAFVAMTDEAGTLLFAQGLARPWPAGDLRALVARLRALGAAPRRAKDVPAASALAVQGVHAVRLVMVDLGTLDAQRWLIAGYRLDEELDALREDLRIEALLLARPGAGRAPAVLGATLPEGDDRAALAGAVLTPASGPAAAAQTTSARHRWQLRGWPLETADAGGLELRLARPLDPAVAAGAQMRADLWTAVALALAAFALLLWALARHLVTAGLAELVRAARRLGTQDYDAAVPQGGPVREVRVLAAALDQMRGDLRAEQYFDRRLTQLPNRLHCRQVLARLLEGGTPVAVLLLGVNRFRHVNRVLGYAAGDRLLQVLAERLGRAAPAGSFIARMGGDTFALVLPGVADDGGADAALAVARRLGSALVQPLDLRDRLVDLEAAVGIACVPAGRAGAGDVDRLIAQAELALDAAKQRREFALVYDPTLDTGSATTLSLLTELRQAQANGELRLHLQPKVSLTDGRLAGAEALLRWEHPQRGMVPPGQFIPYAEDTPIIRELTGWVFEAVAREQAALAELGIWPVAVNLSARDLMDVALPERLDALLTRHGARADGICLETTESAVMNDVARAQLTLQRLAERGFKLSIDDFGADQSSMRRLKDLRVHELKIDMDFVKGMQADPRDASLVRAMVELGHALGLSVVAEGVETEALATRLAAMGCDVGQGWHFARAMPLPALREWAREWTRSRVQPPAPRPAAPQGPAAEPRVASEVRAALR